MSQEYVEKPLEEKISYLKKNNFKQGKQPDFKGKMLLNGKTQDVAAWANEKSIMIKISDEWVKDPNWKPKSNSRTLEENAHIQDKFNGYQKQQGDDKIPF